MTSGSLYNAGHHSIARRRRTLSMQTLPLFAANGARIAVQLALIPILARIITPEAFGLVALAMPIIIFTSILAEAGLVTGLVRSDVSPAAEASAFWFTALVGCACTAMIALAAGPIGWAAHQAGLARILLALSPSLLFTCLTIVPSARLQRTGAFGAFATGETLSCVAGAGAALWSALHGWGAWSLVAQQVTLTTVRMASNLRLSRFTPQPQFDYGLLHPVLKLSTPLLGANMLAYLARSLDNLLIGLAIGAKPLGYYATAYQVVIIPEFALGASIRTTTMPAIAKVAHDRQAAGAVYVGALRTLSLMAAPAVVYCSLQAEALVRLVLGPAWAPAAPLVAILAPLGLVHCYFQLNTAVLLGFGEARTQLRMSVFVSVCGLAGIVAGFPWGPRGVALGYALGTLFAAGPYFFYVLRALGAPWRRLTGGVSRAWIGGAVMAASMSAWTQHAAPHASLLGGLAEAGLVGGGAYLTTLLVMEQLRPSARRRSSRLLLEI